MPVYSMRNNETSEEFEINIKYSELETYLKENPHITQIFTKFPGTADPARLGRVKVPDSFKEVLKKAKDSHRHSTVNTW